MSEGDLGVIRCVLCHKKCQALEARWHDFDYGPGVDREGDRVAGRNLLGRGEDGEAGEFALATE